MLKKVKFSKLAIVLFLTILIWVWADLSLEETYPPINSGVIVIGNRTKQNLWISFPSGTSVNINEIILKGPASKRTKLDQILSSTSSQLEFSIIPEHFDINKEGPYPLSVQEIIKESNWIKENNFSIVSCDPCEVTVNAYNLIGNNLEVLCYDAEGLRRNLETSQTITMSVPSNFSGNAQVDLKYEEVQKAIKEGIDKIPFIRLSNGEIKYAASTVRIKLPPEEDTRSRLTVESPTMGYTFSENMLGNQYKVEVDNKSDIMTIEVRATPAAKTAYEEQAFQVSLFIKDQDVDETLKNEFVYREVYYNFPEEYVRKNEIELAREEKVKAKFKVTLITPGDDEN